MSEHNSKTSLNQIGNMADRGNDGRELVGYALMLSILNQRIAANGDDQSFQARERSPFLALHWKVTGMTH